MFESGNIATVVSSLIAYLLGSMPFAYLIARSAGVDIYQVGTGNPGAANTYRKIGKKHGAAVFVLDLGKGAIAIYVAIVIGTPRELLPLIAALVVAGHWFPIFLRFRGGAGLAAGVGAAIGLAGAWAWTAVAIGLVALWIVRDSPRAAGVVLTVTVGIAIFNGPDWPGLIGMFLVCVMLLIRYLIVERPFSRRQR